MKKNDFLERLDAIIGESEGIKDFKIVKETAELVEEIGAKLSNVLMKMPDYEIIYKTLFDIGFVDSISDFNRIYSVHSPVLAAEEINACFAIRNKNLQNRAPICLVGDVKRPETLAEKIKFTLKRNENPSALFLSTRYDVLENLTDASRAYPGLINDLYESLKTMDDEYFALLKKTVKNIAEDVMAKTVDFVMRKDLSIDDKEMKVLFNPSEQHNFSVNFHYCATKNLFRSQQNKIFEASQKLNEIFSFFNELEENRIDRKEAFIRLSNKGFGDSFEFWKEQKLGKKPPHGEMLDFVKKYEGFGIQELKVKVFDKTEIGLLNPFSRLTITIRMDSLPEREYKWHFGKFVDNIRYIEDMAYDNPRAFKEFCNFLENDLSNYLKLIEETTLDLDKEFEEEVKLHILKEKGEL